jgi:hypothetical protein
VLFFIGRLYSKLFLLRPRQWNSSLKLIPKRLPEPPLPLRPPTGSVVSPQSLSSPQLAGANALSLIIIIAILCGPCPTSTKKPNLSMTPDVITFLFKEARDAFLPFEEKPTDGDLLSIRKTLLLILMKTTYNQLGGIQSLTAILTDVVRYATNHGGNAFVCPTWLPLYDGTIVDDKQPSFV